MSTYKKRIEAGLCGKCGSPDKEEGKSLCLPCAEKTRLKAAEKRKRAKDSGMCHACNTRPIAEGSKSRCEQCLETGRQYAKKQQQERKANGLCMSCGKQSPMEGKTICQDCSVKMTKVSADRYQARREAGKCNYCDNDPVPGSTMCQYHLDKTHDQRVAARREVITHYTNGTCACVLCGDAEFTHLEIDHIDGGGRDHAREIQVGSGSGLIGWIRRNNFPEGFRVLCRNCNAKVHTEICDSEGHQYNATRKHNINN